MKKHIKIINTGFILLLLSGCSSLSNLKPDAAVATGVLAYAAVSESSDGKIPNYGTTHAMVSYGISEAVADFADRAFPKPEQEWLADSVAIAGAIAPAAYYYDRENDGKDQGLDDKADWILPVGNLARVIWRRLTEEQ